MQLRWNFQFSSTLLGFSAVSLRSTRLGYRNLMLHGKHGAIRRMPFNWCDGSCVVFEHCNCYTTENRNNINNDEHKVTLKSSTFFIMILSRSILLNKKYASPPHPPGKKQCCDNSYFLAPWTTICWVGWRQRYGVSYFEDVVQKTNVGKSEFSSSWSP